MIDVNNYLDLYDLFVNEIAGSPIVFTFLALIVILFFAARFRFPNIVTLGVMIVFLLFMSPYISGILILVLIFVGAFFTFAMNRLIGNR